MSAGEHAGTLGRSRWRTVVFAIAAVLAMLASVPIVWHLSARSRVDRLDATIARRTAEYLSFPGAARDGDRDCDTGQEIARLAIDPGALAPSDGSVRAMHGALACRRAWNAVPAAGGRIAVRIRAFGIVSEYLAAVELEEPDACLEGATTALLLAERLAAGADDQSGGVGYAADRMMACVGRASPGARAAALAAIEPLALAPRAAWITVEPAALQIATIYATDARERIGFRALVASVERPSALLEAQRSEQRAQDALAFSDASRACDDACLVRLERRSRTYPPTYGSGGARQPMLEATFRLISSRAVLRALVVALDETRVSDPRLASPWDGTPMRVLHEGRAVRVEWNHQGKIVAELPSPPPWR